MVKFNIEERIAAAYAAFVEREYKGYQTIEEIIEENTLFPESLNQGKYSTPLLELPIAYNEHDEITAVHTVYCVTEQKERIVFQVVNPEKTSNAYEISMEFPLSHEDMLESLNGGSYNDYIDAQADVYIEGVCMYDFIESIKDREDFDDLMKNSFTNEFVATNDAGDCSLDIRLNIIEESIPVKI